jgi:bacterioferritin-associated ferredoxin
MYICICAAVSDKAIREAVAEGATTLDDLRVDLGVAMNCGSCASAAEGVICAAKARLVHVDEMKHCAPLHHSGCANEDDAGPSAPSHLLNPPARVWPIFESA